MDVPTTSSNKSAPAMSDVDSTDNHIPGPRINVIRQQMSMRDVHRQSSTSLRRQSILSAQSKSSLQLPQLGRRRSSLTQKKPPVDLDKQLIREIAAQSVVGLEEALEHLDDKKPEKSEFHQAMNKFANLKTFSGLILFVILLNTGILIAMTSQTVTVRAGWVFAALDSIFLGIYIMEIVIKLYAWRKAFFDEGWNILDFVIVLCGIVDFTLPLIIQNVAGFNGTAIFRILRIFRAVRAIRALRVLKTIRFLNTLQAIMTTLLQSIRSIGAIVILISLFMYMFAVVGRGLYAEADPNHFGNLFYSLFTLFQLLTLDDWFEIYKTVTKYDPGLFHIIIYLLLYIIVEYFIFLNLFVAVLVDNFQLTLEEQSAANKRKKLMQHDDDGDLEDDTLVSGKVKEGDDDEAFRKDRKSVKDWYPTLDEETQADMEQYFRLLTALEHITNTLADQQKLLDTMVDMEEELDEGLQF